MEEKYIKCPTCGEQVVEPCELVNEASKCPLNPKRKKNEH
jgi:hypothetical protein